MLMFDNPIGEQGHDHQFVHSFIYYGGKTFQKIQTFYGQEILKGFKVLITAYNI